MTPEQADQLDDAVATAGTGPVTPPERFRGGYAETPEETVERATRRGPQANRVHLLELVLRYPAGDYTTVVTGLQTLTLRRGHSTIRDTVAELVAEALTR
jgi:hypothetical protein